MLVALVSSGCATAPEADLFNNRGCGFYGQSFCTAAIGDGIYISNGPDFLVYSFNFDELTVLAIYEGDHPQEYGPEEYIDMKVGAVMINYREFDDGETFHRYYRNPNIDRPRFLHMMSPVNLSEEQQEFIDYALSTLRYCMPSGASMICD